MPILIYFMPSLGYTAKRRDAAVQQRQDQTVESKVTQFRNCMSRSLQASQNCLGELKITNFVACRRDQIVILQCHMTLAFVHQSKERGDLRSGSLV